MTSKPSTFQRQTVTARTIVESWGESENDADGCCFVTQYPTVLIGVTGQPCVCLAKLLLGNVQAL